MTNEISSRCPLLNGVVGSEEIMVCLSCEVPKCWYDLKFAGKRAVFGRDEKREVFGSDEKREVFGSDE